MSKKKSPVPSATGLYPEPDLKEVARRVVEHRQEDATSRLVHDITTALRKSDMLNRELADLKPDEVTYRADGSVANKYYSESRIRQRTLLNAHIVGLTLAIDKALDGDPSKLPAAMEGPEKPEARGQWVTVGGLVNRQWSLPVYGGTLIGTCTATNTYTNTTPVALVANG